VAYVVGGLGLALVSLEPVSLITNFTWVVPAQTWLLLYGFLAMTLFGAMYYIVPRLTGVALSSKLMTAQFWLAAIGLVIYVAPLVIGGIEQGLALKESNTGFLQIMQGTLMFLRAGTMGELAMLTGHLLLLLNLGCHVFPNGEGAQAVFKAGWMTNAKAGVTS